MTSQDVLGLKVVVIAGGWSDEKEISLDSGRACQKALTEVGFKGVDLLDAADGEFCVKARCRRYDVAFCAMARTLRARTVAIQGLSRFCTCPTPSRVCLGAP